MELHIRHLSKTYPNGTQALKDLSVIDRQGNDNVVQVSGE